MTPRDQLVWDAYLRILAANPKQNTVDGVRTAAMAVDAFEKWQRESRASKKEAPPPALGKIDLPTYTEGEKA